MPYIKQERRGQPIITFGELNYAITRLCLDFIAGMKPSYETYNSIVGVLECVKQEFYRRAIAPYEDEKRKEHGDVY